MSNTIILKKSGVLGKAPLTSNLSLGEIAINYKDGYLFYRDNESSPAVHKINAGDADTVDGFHLNQNVLTTSTPTFDKVRLTNGSDASLSSTDHAFQVGASSGLNLIIDNNEILSRSNGSAAVLYFQNDGGDVRIGSNGGTARFYVQDGSAAAPAITFNNDANTGIYRIAADELGITSGGTLRARFNSTGIVSSANVYTASGSDFRNYGGIWKASTGLTGNGFRFSNTVDGTALTISSTGDTVASGSVTATSLVKSGGSSSEFLKADGSIDSNTYLTTSSASSTYLPLAGGTLTGGLSGTTASFSGNVGIIGTGNLSVRNTSSAGSGIQFLDATWSAGIEHNNGKLFFRSGGQNDRMTIHSGGNVGIGTTSPETKLHILTSNEGVKTTYADVAIEAVDAQLDLTSSSSGSWGSAINFVEGASVSANTDVWSIARQTTGGNGDSSLRFNFGTSNQHDNAHKVTFASSGNVGIGTTSPNHLLEIDGGTENAFIQLTTPNSRYGGIAFGDPQSAIAGRIQYYHGDDSFQFDTDGKFTFEGGNVGIGTTSPNALLELSKNGGGSSTTLLNVGGTGNGRMLVRHIDGKLHTSDATDDLYLNYLSSGHISMVNGGGNVGIGTTSPSQKLHVVGNTTTTGVSYTDIVQTYSGSSIDFRHQDASVVMRVDTANARIGIGTTSPAKKLEVNVGGTSSDGILVVGSLNPHIEAKDSTNSVRTVIASEDSLGKVGTISSTDLKIVTSNTERIRVDTSGNVGIGDTTPAYKLDVIGTLRTTSAAYFNNDVVVTNNLTLTGAHKPTFTTPDDTVYTPSYNWVTATPFNAAWHDLIAFDRNYTTTQEISTDGTNFSSDTLELGLFDQKDKTKYEVVGNGERAVRWTWTGVAYSVGRYFHIAAGYSSPSPSCTVKIETSSDGSTWTEIHSSSGIPFSAINRFYYVDPYVGDGGDNYVRLTIDKGNTDTKTINLTSIKMLTQRLADQGQGREDELPFYYDKNQNIGIGVAAPDGPLHVQYNDSTARSSVIDNTTVGLRVENTNSNGVSQIHLRAGDADAHILVEDVGSNAADMFFSVDGTEPAMVIKNDGNVGIGTNDPDTKLHIALAGGSAQLTLERTGGSAGKAVLAGAAEGLIVYDDAFGPKMYVGTSGTYNGKVGIGTTSPSQKLTVAAGHILLDNNQQIRFKDSGGTERTIVQLSSSNDLFIGGSYAGALKFMGGGSYTEQMRIHDDGNVGIGTTSPSNALEISNASFANQLRVLRPQNTEGGIAGIINIAGFNSASVVKDYARIGVIIDDNTNATEDGSLVLQTITNGTNTEKVRINASGNVGIGTTSPAEKLHVGGDIRVGNGGSSEYNHVNFTRAGGSNVGAIGWHSDNNFYVGGHPSYGPTAGNIVRVYGFGSDIRLGDNTNGDVLTVDATNGNVGIGDTTPSYKLDVAGDIRATGDLRADDDIFIAGNTLRFTNDAASAYIQSVDTLYIEADSNINDTGGKPIIFRTAGTTKMTIAGDGDVTIDNDLIVSGDLTVNGTTTTINSTTVQVDDKNIELGSVASPTDTTADGGGITLKGATDKTINWVNSTSSWTSNQTFSAPNLTLTNLSTYSGSDITALMISGGNIVGKRALGTAAFSATSDFATASHNHTLDSLSNTTITSNTSGEILKWNGSAWINNTLAEAGIAAAGDENIIDGATSIWNADGDGDVFTYNDSNPTHNSKGTGAVIYIRGDGSNDGGLVRAGIFTSDHVSTANGYYVGTLLGTTNSTTTQVINNSGEWTGAVISSAKLDADTAHLSGTQTFSGAKTFSVNPKISHTGNISFAMDKSDATTTTNLVSYVSFQAGGSEVGWFGFGSNGSSDLTLRNTNGKVVLNGSSGSDLGTVVSGTWNGSVIASAYLDSDTAHLSGTQTFSGAKTFSSASKFASLWSSSTIESNSFYVQNSTDGFAFGVGTSISTWFSWDNNAGLKRAIDVWNDGSKILLGNGGHDVEVSNDLLVSQYISHTGDTDTFIRFQPNDVNLTAAGQNLLRVDGNSTQKTVVVNEVGIDADFRVESSGEANALFVRGSDGNVGIGTTNPAAKLHVYNSAGGDATDKAGMLSEAVMKLQPHASNSTNMLFAQVNSGNGIGIQVTNGPATANWDIALSPFGGNVGIGDTSPSYKLDVAGTFRSTGIANLNSGAIVTSGGISINSGDLTVSSGDVVITDGVLQGPSRFIIDPSPYESPYTSPLNNSPQSTGEIIIRGDLEVEGHLAATTKSFLVDNPRTGGKLQYGVVESDEHGVYVRGKTDQNMVELPEEWEWLVDEDSVTVQLTSIGQMQSLFVIEQNNKYITVGGLAHNGQYNYVIYGTRKDVDPLEKHL